MGCLSLLFAKDPISSKIEALTKSIAMASRCSALGGRRTPGEARSGRGRAASARRGLDRSTSGVASGPRDILGKWLDRLGIGREGWREEGQADGKGRKMLPAALAAVVGISAAVPLYANALTEENLIYLEAWRAVYQAYFDGTYNGNNWFKLKDKTLKDYGGMATRNDTYAAIESNLSVLDDPYTKLLDPSKYAFIKGNKKGGGVSGVGLEIAYPKDKGTDGIVVVNTQPGSPAEKSGLKSNQILTRIGDASTTGMSIYEAAGLLKGEKGTTVSIQVRDQGSSEVSTYDLERKSLSRTSVSSKFCSTAGARGYIRLGSFSDLTDVEVRKAVQDLKSSGATEFVLDMRNNGGGSFDAGVNVARIFINEGVIVNIADSKGIKDYFEAKNAAEDASSPLTVIVNGGTASAAEVLAGALQDNKRAALVGERTFGKGLIQTLVGLSDGSGVAVSVAKYQTPNETDINKKGIMPDKVLENLPALSDDPCAIADAARM